MLYIIKMHLFGPLKVKISSLFLIEVMTLVNGKTRRPVSLFTIIRTVFTYLELYSILKVPLYKMFH